VCGKSVERAPEQVLPFCSPSCKLADLGRWLDGSYRVPGPPLEIESDGHTLPGGASTEDR
jgi:endogenous inhibitor of DNA gyrase (YacG/DUF329 family)